MTLKLFELAGADDLRFSPFCWRTRMALAHKGLEAERVPVRFTEKHLIAFSGQKLVPVLVDGDATVFDSWSIACHLEGAYPDAPALFAGGEPSGACRLINHWMDRVVMSGMFRMIVFDICRHLDPADQAYFRETRERRFGMPLEEVQADREERLPAFRASLSPLRASLRERLFLDGDAPGYADYIVFGSFQWARSVCDFPLLERSDPTYDWLQRMLGLFDGLAGKAQGYAW